MDAILDHSSDDIKIEEPEETTEIINNTADPEFIVSGYEDINSLPVFNIDPETPHEELSTVQEKNEPIIDMNGKEILYHDCCDYRKALIRDGEDIEHIPKPSLDMSLEQLQSLHKLHKYAYNKIANGSITKDAVTTFSGFVSNVFDGSIGIGDFNPSMKGWDDDIQCRISADPNFRKSINECSLSFSNPWINLGMQILLSGVSFMRNSKKKKSFNQSNIRKAVRNMDEL